MIRNICLIPVVLFLIVRETLWALLLTVINLLFVLPAMIVQSVIRWYLSQINGNRSNFEILELNKDVKLYEIFDYIAITHPGEWAREMNQAEKEMHRRHRNESILSDNPTTPTTWELRRKKILEKKANET